MTGVKKKGLFKTDHPLRDQSIALNARKVVSTKQAIENCEAIDNKYEKIEENTKVYRTGVENRLQDQVFERRLSATLDRLVTEGRTMIFKDIFSTIVIESLIIDKPEVEKREPEIRSLIESFIDKEGGFAFLEKAVDKSQLPILKAIKKICVEAAKETTSRIRRDAVANKDAVDPNYIDFSMNDEEKSKLDYAKSEIALPEVSELVANKVLTVVKDEKQRAQDMTEMEEAIKAEIQEETGEEPTSEAFQVALESRIINKQVSETSTLFDATLRNTTKNALLEKASSYDADPESNADEFFQTGIDVINHHLYDMPEDDNELDLILAESVLQYTILEAASTIRLIDMGPKEIKSYTELLLK